MAKLRNRQKELEEARRRQRRVLLTLGVVGLLVVGLVVVLAVRDPNLRGAGGVLPFTLPDQNGESVTIEPDGHPIVVEIMATWCPYCAYFAQYDLAEAAAFLKDQGARFVSLNSTALLGIGTPGSEGQPGSGQDGSRATPTGDRAAAIQAEMRRYVETYPAMKDVIFLDDSTLAVGDRFHFTGYPTLVILDGRGKVLSARAGVFDVDEFKRWYLDTVGGSR